MQTITRGQWTGQISQVLNANLHHSAETALVVDDYPYGFRLRCKIRYWLESNGKGTRFWSQTTNPKRTGEVWNKPKASTYAEISGALYLDEKNHVQWLGFGQYCDEKEASEFLSIFGENVTNYKEAARFTRLKVIFEEELGKFSPRPDYGTALFQSAYASAIHRSRQEQREAKEKEGAA